jgi:hypothetical protein
MEISLSISKLRGTEGKATSPLVGITGRLIFSTFSIYLDIGDPFLGYTNKISIYYSTQGCEKQMFLKIITNI